MIFHEVFDKAGGISATDNGDGVLFFANHFGYNGRSGGVGGVFGVAEKAIPDDGLGVSDEICDFGGGNWANVELLAFGVFVKIFGDVDFMVFCLVAVGGDFAAYDDLVGNVGEFFDEGLFVFDFGATDDE